MTTGHAEVRRSRRLVVSSIATVGNYEYGFFWYFYLDGTIQLEVKLTGIMSTQAVAPGEPTPYANLVAEGWRPRSTSTCSAPGSTSTVDGPVNRAYEVSFEAAPAGRRTTRGATPSASGSTCSNRSQAARRDVDPAGSRHWRFENPTSRNALGRPVAYRLVPGPTPTLLARPDSSIAQPGRIRPAQPVGHPVPRRTSGGPRATIRTSTPVATGSPAGRRPTGHWWTPTSWPGTPSASATPPGPRTGR